MSHVRDHVRDCMAGCVSCARFIGCGTHRLSSKSTENHDKDVKKSLSLNLTRVRKQLKKKLAWTDARVRAIEKEYRTFLSQVRLDNGIRRRRPLSEDMDQFWHFHILDTPKYTKDCQRLFGLYLHHKPE